MEYKIYAAATIDASNEEELETLLNAIKAFVDNKSGKVSFNISTI